MNQFMMSGYLSKDPEVIDSANTEKCVLNVAVRHNSSRVDYFRVFAWGSLARQCAVYLRKGNNVLVQGHMESGINADKRFFTVFAAEKVDFMRGSRAEYDPQAAEADEPLSA